MSKPWLLLDIDGPLNPYAEKSWRRPDGYETHRLRGTGNRDEPKAGYLVWLNPSHGERLLSLGYELAWATTWEHLANSFAAPRLGLPELPVIEWRRRETGWPPRQVVSNLPGPGGSFFKTQQVIDWAAGRPFVWIDDDIRDLDVERVKAQTGGRSWARWCDPRRGLDEGHFRWLEEQLPVLSGGDRPSTQE